MRMIIIGHNLQSPSSMNSDPKDFFQGLYYYVLFLWCPTCKTITKEIIQFILILPPRNKIHSNVRTLVVPKNEWHIMEWKTGCFFKILFYALCFFPLRITNKESWFYCLLISSFNKNSTSKSLCHLLYFSKIEIIMFLMGLENHSSGACSNV